MAANVAMNSVAVVALDVSTPLSFFLSNIDSSAEFMIAEVFTFKQVAYSNVFVMFVKYFNSAKKPKIAYSTTQVYFLTHCNNCNHLDESASEYLDSDRLSPHLPETLAGKFGHHSLLPVFHGYLAIR